MKERPILFRASMVRAILEGRKTQTRRVLKRQPPAKATFAGQYIGGDNHGGFHFCQGDEKDIDTWTDADFPVVHCPYGMRGDRLWVRETHAIMSTDSGTVSVAYRERMPVGKTLADTDAGLDVISVSDPTAWQWANAHIDCERWRPSIFMPRWASRITLEISDVRVERLQEISEEDARAEGAAPWHEAELTSTGEHCGERRAHYAGFADLWQGINGEETWKSNPWVWALTFKKVQA
jgi:hypothetical protein